MEKNVESIRLSKAENGTIVTVEYKIPRKATEANPEPYPDYQTRTHVYEGDLISEVLGLVSSEMEDESSEMEDENEMETKVEVKKKISKFEPKNFR
jgi:hypothetical protein